MKSIISDTFNNISKSRAFLMGIAMLWIVSHHCNNLASLDIPVFIKFPLCNLGYGGVDLFIFLSGFGIYCSLNKNFDLGKFIMKRYIRLLPALPILIIYIIYKFPLNISNIIGLITFTNFEIGKPSPFAFVSLIFCFYLISPILFGIINKYLINNKKKLAFLFLLFIMSIAYWGEWRLYGVTRLITYVLGMYMAYFCIKKTSFNIKYFWVFILLSITSFCCLICIHLYIDKPFIDTYGLGWYSFVLFIPGFTFFIANLNEYLKNNIMKYKNFDNIISFIGNCTLEIYMIDYFLTTVVKIQPFFIHFALSLILGIAYHFIYQKFYNIILIKNRT